MIEFSRRIEIEKVVKTLDGVVDIFASDEECEKLKNRFGFLKITSLSLKGVIKEREYGKTFRFKGVLTAEIIQKCMETEKPVEESIEEKIEILLTYKMKDDVDYLEDIEEIDSGFVDFGEISSQYLSLSASPYPLCKTF
ncbi:MAG: hypothetical protein KBD31_05585 [Proteobacteria bacterium]|nr:hypothetical protein [Pseudomonadota bacterium]